MIQPEKRLRTITLLLCEIWTNGVIASVGLDVETYGSREVVG